VVEVIVEVMDDELWCQSPRRLEMAVMQTIDDAVFPEVTRVSIAKDAEISSDRRGKQPHG
jgi:hypothetical protein